MSQKERINKILDYLKSAINGVVLMLVGMVSYVFIHFEELNTIKVILISVTSTCLIILLGMLLKTVIKKLDELGDL